MKIIHPVLFTFAATLILFAGCTFDKTPFPLTENIGGDCDSTHIYFLNDVLPILNSNCAKSGCHDAVTNEEGYNFSTHASAFSAIEPGKLNQSKLYKSITESVGEKMMPPAGNSPLSTEQIDIIARWIIQGGLNDSCTADSSGCNTLNMSYANDISPIISGNCAGCHSGASPSGGINLSTYSGLAAFAGNGKLYNAIAQNGLAQSMPPSLKLTTCKIRQIKSWVDAGYPDN